MLTSNNSGAETDVVVMPVMTEIGLRPRRVPKIFASFCPDRCVAFTCGRTDGQAAADTFVMSIAEYHRPFCLRTRAVPISVSCAIQHRFLLIVLYGTLISIRKNARAAKLPSKDNEAKR